MDDFNKKKYSELINILSSYKRVAIAFSGGIDSTLLMYAAVDALGTDAVTAVTFSSCLQPTNYSETVKCFFKKQFGSKAQLILRDMDPLGWDAFLLNAPDRCYQCKKRMYAEFSNIVQNTIETESDITLCDGTNYSDLSNDRPGYQAIKEINIATPLAEVLLAKAEIRKIAWKKNISNWDQASDSCLATRIETDTVITLPLLKTIEKGEKYFHGLGFKGCRVRHQGDVVVIQVLKPDLKKLTKVIELNPDLNQFFSMLGYKDIVLDPLPRKG